MASEKGYAFYFDRSFGAWLDVCEKGGAIYYRVFSAGLRDGG